MQLVFPIACADTKVFNKLPRNAAQLSFRMEVRFNQFCFGIFAALHSCNSSFAEFRTSAKSATVYNKKLKMIKINEENLVEIKKKIINIILTIMVSTDQFQMRFLAHPMKGKWTTQYLKRGKLYNSYYDSNII